MNARTLVTTSALALAIACGGSGSQASLSLSAQAAPGATPSTPTSLDLGNGISLDRVRMVVRKLKLEGTVAAPDGGTSGTMSSPKMSGAGDDGRTEMEREADDANEPVLGPFLVDLSAGALAGGIHQVFDGMVPQGTFHELKFVIGPVSVDQAGTDAKLADMASQNASIIVDGTIDGTSFSFVSGLVAEFDREGELVVNDGKSNNITLSIDPKGWFGGAGSARLDPTVGANRSAIESNIKASIEAFEDDDRDGHDGQDDGPGHT